MKHSAHAIEGNTDSGTSPLTDFCPTSHQQAFYIRPGNIRSNGVFKNRLQSFTMFGFHSERVTFVLNSLSNSV